MDLKKLTGFIKRAQKKGEYPILLIAYIFYDCGRKKRNKVCGKLHGFNAAEGSLWIQNDGRAPFLLHSDDISSIREMPEEELINNTNILLAIQSIGRK